MYHFVCCTESLYDIWHFTSSACGAGCKNCDSTGACIECMEDYRLDSGSCVGKYVFTVIPQWLSLELRGKTLLTITSICLQLAHLSARPAQLMPPLVPMCALCVITPMDLSSQPAPPVTVSRISTTGVQLKKPNNLIMVSNLFPISACGISNCATCTRSSSTGAMTCTACKTGYNFGATAGQCASRCCSDYSIGTNTQRAESI